ncbi:hypothetical protein GKC29_14890 [Micromonospora sp. WMMC415]|uniref:hypothetical protein n=1 Tax=Micromonospora sp. WMMC415 TaxID=2675222 RepID=UPI0012B4687B|nr:hypothetical protein [Micromonospora sp. WMMC415]QGN48004.1 hypothetical protein GKC29_14890 [Micromonospora sp. WMMC415]
MGADMALRSLYLPTGHTINRTAATDTIRQLCREATIADLRVLLDHGWIDDQVPYSEDTWTEEALTARAATLRQAAETELIQLFDRFARSLGHRDVTRHRFDNGDEGIDAYETGGLSWGDGPTEAYDAWDVVHDTGRLPATWSDQFGAAAGLLHPVGRRPGRHHRHLPSLGLTRPTTKGALMSRVIRRIDRGARTIDGIDLHLTELVWDDGGRSFEVRRTDTDLDLTEDGCLDTWPTDEHLANLLRDHAGSWSCLGCGAAIGGRQTDLITDHVRDCDAADRSPAGPRDR